MIGVVICCHGKMGDGMRDAAEMIVGPQEQIGVVSVDPGVSGAEILDKLKAAVRDVDSGEGVLLFTDLFGGTPTNIACALLGEASIEVITGFNLPLLIKALTVRQDSNDLHALARDASEYGRRHISVAGELLHGSSGDKEGIHEP
ncbi:MAG: PTS sugar transporter subunit IIA [Myxococcota bacterium]|nr:PTS sugar transporter subunit IIA [Myxococcota bacterium]